MPDSRPSDPEARDDGRCVCGSGAASAKCCLAIIRSERAAVTAEQLMRSRYTAFVRLDADYLRHSWAPEKTPKRLRLDPARRWTGLVIVDAAAGGMLDSEGIVEFVARFEDGPNAGALRERSTFRRHDGRWVSVDAEPT
jgi:SEC-C motif-containing protein